MEIAVEQRRGCLNFAPNLISLEDRAIIIHDIDLLSLNGSFVSEGCENFALPEKLTNFRKFHKSCFDSTNSILHDKAQHNSQPII